MTGDTYKNWSREANPGKTICYFGGADRSAGLVTLDNFSTLFTFTLSTLSYPSIEHAFQSIKFRLAARTDPDPSSCLAWADRIRLAPTPQEAKRLGRERRLAREFLDDWKLGLAEKVMTDSQTARFEQNEDVRGILLGLKEDLLVEKVEDDPTWDDRIWGCGRDWVGENKMGLILMDIREKMGAGSAST